MSREVSLDSDQRFRALIEHSSDAIALLTPDGSVTYASPSTERVTGYPATELVGRNSFALLHPEDLEDVRQQFTALLDRPGDFITLEYRLYHTDGTWHRMEGTLTNRLADPAVGAVVCNYRDLTPRKQGLERRRLSQERFRVLVERASVGIFVTDLAGRIVQVNPVGCVLSGYTREELLTRHVEDLVPEEDRAAVRARIERLRAGETTSTQARLQRKDGSLLPVELSATLLSTGHLLGFVHDISARIQAEQARRQLLAYERAARAEAEATRARLYEFLHQAPVRIMALRGPEHRLEYANLQVLQIERYADRVGKPAREGWPEFVEQGLFAILDEVYTTGTPFIGAEVPLKVDRIGDGVLVEAYLNLVYQPLRDTQGNIDGILAYSVDVTEQVQARHRVEELNRQLEAEKDAMRQAEQEAQARTAELEAIFEAMTEGVIVCDARGDVRYTNAAYRSLVALEEDTDPSLLQLDKRMAWLNYRDLEGRPLLKEQGPMLRVLRGERLSGQHRMDALCHTYKGGDIILNISGAPIRDAAGQIVGGVVVLRDVTERRRLEQQLRSSEGKLRMLVESNIFGVAVTDGAGRIYEVNDCYAQVVGYRKDELLAETFNWHQLVPQGYQETQAHSEETLLSTGALPPQERETLRKDGDHVPILMAGAMFDQERDLALTLILDISEQKAAERRKQEFLSMVSHELRTPLQSIMGFIDLALLYSDLFPRPLSPEAEKLMGKMETGLKRAMRQVEIETRLVEELLEVSRLDLHKFELSLHPENLVTIVRETVANQQQAARTRHIELVLPPEELVPVLADADRIGQVLTNYLTNALKYAPVEQPVSVRLEVRGTVARVSVRDQGPGLTPEQQKRVWERFYQVAAPGRQGPDRGLGLGLAIARSIVEQHQGQVGAQSAPGHGATFWFTLPMEASPQG
jgi:PAS domain S-box-containing protein